MFSAAHFLPGEATRSRTIDIIAVVVLLASFGLFAAQHSRSTLYVYAVFPVFFWHQAITRSVGYVMSLLRGELKSQLFSWTGLAYIILAVLSLEGMVVGQSKLAGRRISDLSAPDCIYA